MPLNALRWSAWKDSTVAALPLSTARFCRRREGELHQVVGRGAEVAVLVLDADGDEGEVVAIRGMAARSGNRA